MFDEETMEFIKEREEKLGAPMLWRSYATWYAEKGRERREYGVFVYTDGETLVFEDFFRPATLLGYTLETKREKQRKKDYVKMEIPIPISSITQISLVTKGRAEKALREDGFEAKECSTLGRFFNRTVTMVKTIDRTFFIEIPEHKVFKEKIQNYRERRAK